MQRLKAVALKYEAVAANDKPIAPTQAAMRTRTAQDRIGHFVDDDDNLQAVAEEVLKSSDGTARAMVLSVLRKAANLQ